MDKFRKQIAVAYDGKGDQRILLVDDKPHAFVSLHGTKTVAIYKLDRVVTVVNESRIVEPKRKR